jgi:tripartite-type tricarboxylate transporter receptor subunit TctC
MRTGFLVALALWAATAFGQSYPTKPIRIVVPLVPGGNQDIVARAVAEELSKGLGQPVIVENRPGQSAIIGTQFVKSAPPDGYTLLSVAVTFARVPAVVKAEPRVPHPASAGRQCQPSGKKPARTG